MIGCLARERESMSEEKKVFKIVNEYKGSLYISAWKRDGDYGKYISAAKIDAEGVETIRKYIEGKEDVYITINPTKNKKSDKSPDYSIKITVKDTIPF